VIAGACPQGHIHGAYCLGAEVKGARDEDAAEILAGQLIKMMKATGIPNGIGGTACASPLRVVGKSDQPWPRQKATSEEQLLGASLAAAGERNFT